MRRFIVKVVAGVTKNFFFSKILLKAKINNRNEIFFKSPTKTT